MSRDPKGRRALFDGGDVAPPEPPAEGRRAFYSAPSPAERAGGASIHCSACGQRSQVSRLELARRVASLSVWAPWRRDSRWITCPACRRRAWCEVRWW